MANAELDMELHESSTTFSFDGEGSNELDDDNYNSSITPTNSGGDRKLGDSSTKGGRGEDKGDKESAAGVGAFMSPSPRDVRGCIGTRTAEKTGTSVTATATNPAIENPLSQADSCGEGAGYTGNMLGKVAAPGVFDVTSPKETQIPVGGFKGAPENAGLVDKVVHLSPESPDESVGTGLFLQFDPTAPSLFTKSTVAGNDTSQAKPPLSPKPPVAPVRERPDGSQDEQVSLSPKPQKSMESRLKDFIGSHALPFGMEPIPDIVTPTAAAAVVAATTTTSAAPLLSASCASSRGSSGGTIAKGYTGNTPSLPDLAATGFLRAIQYEHKMDRAVSAPAPAPSPSPSQLPARPNLNELPTIENVALTTLPRGMPSFEEMAGGNTSSSGDEVASGAEADISSPGSGEEDTSPASRSSGSGTSMRPSDNGSRSNSSKTKPTLPRSGRPSGEGIGRATSSTTKHSFSSGGSSLFGQNIVDTASSNDLRLDEVSLAYSDWSPNYESVPSSLNDTVEISVGSLTTHTSTCSISTIRYISSSTSGSSRSRPRPVGDVSPLLGGGSPTRPESKGLPTHVEGISEVVDQAQPDALQKSEHAQKEAAPDDPAGEKVTTPEPIPETVGPPSSTPESELSDSPIGNRAILNEPAGASHAEEGTKQQELKQLEPLPQKRRGRSSGELSSQPGQPTGDDKVKSPRRHSASGRSRQRDSQDKRREREKRSSSETRNRASGRPRPSRRRHSSTGSTATDSSSSIDDNDRQSVGSLASERKFAGESTKLPASALSGPLKPPRRNSSSSMEKVDPGGQRETSRNRERRRSGGSKSRSPMRPPSSKGKLPEGQPNDLTPSDTSHGDKGSDNGKGRSWTRRTSGGSKSRSPTRPSSGTSGSAKPPHRASLSSATSSDDNEHPIKRRPRERRSSARSRSRSPKKPPVEAAGVTASGPPRRASNEGKLAVHLDKPSRPSRGSGTRSPVKPPTPPSGSVSSRRRSLSSTDTSVDSKASPPSLVGGSESRSSSESEGPYTSRLPNKWGPVNSKAPRRASTSSIISQEDKGSPPVMVRNRERRLSGDSTIRSTTTVTSTLGGSTRPPRRNSASSATSQEDRGNQPVVVPRRERKSRSPMRSSRRGSMGSIDSRASEFGPARSNRKEHSVRDDQSFATALSVEEAKELIDRIDGARQDVTNRLCRSASPVRATVSLDDLTKMRNSAPARLNRIRSPRRRNFFLGQHELSPNNSKPTTEKISISRLVEHLSIDNLEELNSASLPPLAPPFSGNTTHSRGTASSIHSRGQFVSSIHSRGNASGSGLPPVDPKARTIRAGNRSIDKVVSTGHDPKAKPTSSSLSPKRNRGTRNYFGAFPLATWNFALSYMKTSDDDDEDSSERLPSLCDISQSSGSSVSSGGTNPPPSSRHFKTGSGNESASSHSARSTISSASSSGNEGEVTTMTVPLKKDGNGGVRRRTVPVKGNRVRRVRSADSMDADVSEVSSSEFVMEGKTPKTTRRKPAVAAAAAAAGGIYGIMKKDKPVRRVRSSDSMDADISEASSSEFMKKTANAPMMHGDAIYGVGRHDGKRKRRPKKKRDFSKQQDVVELSAVASLLKLRGAAGSGTDSDISSVPSAFSTYSQHHHQQQETSPISASASPGSLQASSFDGKSPIWQRIAAEKQRQNKIRARIQAASHQRESEVISPTLSMQQRQRQ